MAVNQGEGNQLDTITRIDTNTGVRATIPTSYRNYGIYVVGQEVQLVDSDDNVGTILWQKVIDSYPGTYQADISEIRLRTETGFIVGTITLNPFDDYKLNVNWDTDTLPTGDVIPGPARDPNSWTSFDKVVDPQEYNPTADKVPGLRLLILDDIGDVSNTDGPDAWKNNNNTDFVANANDLIEWDGASWHIVLDHSDSTNGINQKNLNTNIIYKWTGEEWLQAFEGYYPVGTWDVYLDA